MTRIIHFVTSHNKRDFKTYEFTKETFAPAHPNTFYAVLLIFNRIQYAQRNDTKKDFSKYTEIYLMLSHLFELKPDTIYK